MQSLASSDQTNSFLWDVGHLKGDLTSWHDLAASDLAVQEGGGFVLRREDSEAGGTGRPGQGASLWPDLTTRVCQQPGARDDAPFSSGRRMRAQGPCHCVVETDF